MRVRKQFVSFVAGRVARRCTASAGAVGGHRRRCDRAAHRADRDTCASSWRPRANQLDQARQQYDAMTGGRGMENLLRDQQRNYLPPDWQSLEGALTGATRRLLGAFRAAGRRS